MTEKSDFDYAVDFLIEDVRGLMNETRNMFKSKKPFRKEPMPKELIIKEYNSIPQEMLPILRTNMPEFNEYEDMIRKLTMERANVRL